MSLISHYKVLGLAPGSSMAAIKRAYKREIKIWHPDRYSPESLLRANAEERTKAITAAYAALAAAHKASLVEGPPDPGENDSLQSEARPEKTGNNAPPATTGDWIVRVWRRLKSQWNEGPGLSRPPKATISRKKRSARPTPQPPRQPRFDDILDAARSHPKPADISVTWRRLAARRARYARRRPSSTSSVEAIKPRGPVPPVDRIQAIGEDS